MAPTVCGGEPQSANISDRENVFCESVHSDESECDENIPGEFMYMPVNIKGMQVTALLDTGSSINIISKSLYDKLSLNSKSNFRTCSEQSVKLANNQSVCVFGTASISVQTPCSSRVHSIFVYILDCASHPLILGTCYFISKQIVLDFDKFVTFRGQSKCTKVRCRSSFSVPPNSELFVRGKVSKNKMIGLPGVCSVHNLFLRRGLLLVKSVVTISTNGTVPLKILNPGDEPVFVNKGSILAHFKPLDNSFHIQTIDLDKSPVECANVTLSDSSSAPAVNPHSNEQFLSNFNFNDDLCASDKKSLTECLIKHQSLFVTKENPDIGLTRVVEHQIHLMPGAQPKHHRPYRLPPDKKQVLRHQLDDLLRQNIIAPVQECENVPITSPIVLVSKQNKPKGKINNLTKDQCLSYYRFCCDFRYLNSVTQEFRYNIPDLQELTESFTDKTPNFISSIDMSKGFFQMPISEESTKYTAFNTCYGTFKFLRLPMGLKTSPNSFQLLMDKVLRGLTFKSVLCYLDDVLICSETFEQHLTDLQEVFSRFHSAGLKLQPSKCHFAQRKCVFLGHAISRDGIQPPTNKVELIVNYPPPTSIKELRRIMGLFNWFRKFIPNYSAIAQPILKLMKKNAKFNWTSEQTSAFNELKQLLKNSPVLSFPRYDLEFRLAVDTSCRGLGYMLYQIHEDGTSKVIRFGSKGLAQWQRSYGPTKLELLGMVTAVLDCAPYIRGRHCVIECDHQALKPLFQKQLKGAIYERWLAILQQFDIEIKYKPASEMCVADALSRNPKFPTILESSPEEDDLHFPYVPETPTSVKLPNGQDLHTLFPRNLESNFIKASRCDYDADTEDDFQLPLRKKRLRSKFVHHDKADGNLPSSTEDTICSAPFNKTTEIDNSSGVERNAPYEHATEIDNPCNPQSVQDQPLVSSDNEPSDYFRDTSFLISDVIQKQHSDPELKDLMNYIENGILPDSQKLARDVLVKHSDYALINGMLFHSRHAKSKRAKTFNKYQLVVPRSMVQDILYMHHDSPLAAHGGIQDTLDKIKEHYFFQKMSPIVSDYVKSCQQCQKRKISRMPTKSGVTSYPTPTAPFDVWEIDLYGPLPISTQGSSYIFTAVDMFSKYFVAFPIKTKDAMTVAHAFFKLITTFGVCSTIISDQGSEFIAKVTSELCKMLHVAQQFTPAFAHHCLGACERMHATIAERLTPYVSTDKSNWENCLSSVVFSINCSVNTSLGYSPYEIVFGCRPKFPLVNYHTEPVEINKDIATFLGDKLRKINIIRTEIMENVKKAKDTMLNNANTNLRPLTLQKNDYVFVQKENAHKLQNQFSGPYVVHNIPSAHTVLLKDPVTNKVQDNIVHINRVKKAFVREPTPSDFFSVVSARQVTQKEQSCQTDEVTEQHPVPACPKRPQRTIRPPIRYRDDNHVDPRTIVTFTASSDSDGFHRVKKILGQRYSPNGLQYLIQISGEPADNAFWVATSYLNAKARVAVQQRPPPFID